VSYTKTNPQPANLQPTETAVTLDTGDDVAVAAVCSVASNSGCPVIAATARVINADGTDKLDAQGKPILSAFQHTSCQEEVTATGGMPALQKCVLMAVLGEPTAPLWTDPSAATMLSNASIRTALASASHAGPVDAGALL
jgi:hypothetical protein